MFTFQEWTFYCSDTCEIKEKVGIKGKGEKNFKIKRSESGSLLESVNNSEERQVIAEDLIPILVRQRHL